MMKHRVLETARKTIENGDKPSVKLLSSRLGMHPSTVHRCLNALEKDGEVETYSREVLGSKHRMVGVKRQ